MRSICFPIILILFISLTAFQSSKQLNIPAVRKQLITAINNKQATDSLYQSLSQIKNPPAVVTGYIGALEALKAKHTWNPYYKIKYIGNAEDSFTRAVNLQPHNIEIRFMRFSVEHNLPGFLGYNKNLTADKQEMIKQIELKNYEHTDKELIVSTIKFMLDSKQCTAAENSILNKQLAALK